MLKTGVLVVSFLLVTVASWSLPTDVSRSQKRGPDDSVAPALHVEQAMATSLGNNLSRATQVGMDAPAQSATYVARAESGKWYRQLRDLADDSSDIVIGVPIVAKAYHPPAVESMVFTYYQVQILDSLKGGGRRGSRLSLSVPGGRLVAQDGTSTDVQMPPDWKNPVIGQAYVFFLRNSAHGLRRLVGGPQGLFKISPWPADVASGRVVVPQVNETHKFMKLYKNAGITFFLEQIRQLVAQPRVFSR